MSVTTLNQKIVTDMEDAQWLKIFTDDDARISASNLVTNVLSDLLEAEGFNKTSFDAKYTSVSTTYTVVSTDEIVYCTTTAGAITLNMPQSSTIASGGTTRIYTIKKVTPDANAVIIDPYSNETIDGLASVSLTDTNLPYIRVASDGSNLFTL